MKTIILATLLGVSAVATGTAPAFADGASLCTASSVATPTAAKPRLTH